MSIWVMYALLVGAGSGAGDKPFCFLFDVFCKCFFSAASMLGTVAVGKWFSTASEKENIS